MRTHVPGVVAEQIEAAIGEIETVPGTIRHLRQLAAEHPEAFFRSAAKYLESAPESASARTLADILARQDGVFDHLLDSRLCSTLAAVAVFRRLLAVDPTLDFRLARMLPGRTESSSAKTLTGSHAARALDILDHTSPGQRLLSVVGHLPNSADPRISAKAALFVGRRVSNPAWLEKQLVREDARVRANAIESVWGAKSGTAIRILEECAADANNRVAGNALIGLYMAGCPDVNMRAIGMSLADDPGRRSAAAWVMGKIGSPDFVDCLTSLIRDADPKVRSTAVRSLAEIRRSETKRREIEAERAKAEPKPEIEPAAEPTPEQGTLNIPVPKFERL
jgi:hypothetical protein